MSCWIVLLAAAALGPRAARAQALHVETQVDPCVPLDRDKFEYLLHIELGDEASSASGDTAATLLLQCTENLILISVQDAVTRKVVTRLVSLSNVDPSARERLMALTAAELVLASWMEVRMEPKQVIPPVGPPPPAAIQQRVSEVVEPRVIAPKLPLRLGASASLSTFLSSPAPVYGLALHLMSPFSSHWAWNISLHGGRGRLDGQIGDTAQQVAVSVTTGALAWSLRYTGSVGEWDLWAGLSALVGIAYLTGTRPVSSMLVSTPAYAPWAGPALQLAAAFRASPSFRLLVQLEAGFLVLGTKALVKAREELVVTELRGGWLALQLGFDYAL
jgi:hypothetical protein